MSYCSDAATLSAAAAQASQVREPLAALLLAFFEYWSVGHNYKDSVATVRVPGGYMYKVKISISQVVGT